MTSTTDRSVRTDPLVVTPVVTVADGDPTMPADASSPLLRSVSFVLPCFDEEENVADAIRNAASAATRCCRDYEIVVVDDGSHDRTAAIAAGLVASDPHVRLVVHARNRGYGDALRTGIAAARMDWVLLTDADLQFDLRELEDFVPLTQAADAIWGWRILRQDSARRRASAAVWNQLVRRLFRLPVRDVDCGFKLVRRELLQGFALRSSGAMISTELVVRCQADGARFAEIGVHHRPRVAGSETGGSPRVILRALHELLVMRASLRQLSRNRPAAPVGA